MNYRHVYHAGNFADVLKHAVLARLIVHLQKKDAAFRVIDTHAGVGLYDLGVGEAEKTGEWRGGVGRLIAASAPGAAGSEATPSSAALRGTAAPARGTERAAAPLAPDVAALLSPFWAAVRAANGLPPDPAGAPPDGPLERYPGSPLIARHLLRRQDRLTLTELHPADFQRLSALFAGDIQVKTIELDGWLAVKSFLPPKERRGLVLIDPPFEEPGEFRRMVDALVEAHRRFAAGIVMLWYPIKDERELRGFHEAVVETGLRKILRVDLRVARVEAGRGLTACGLLIVNPPWTLDAELARLVPALAAVMAAGPGASGRVDWLVPE